jgi:hypothetical protein
MISFFQIEDDHGYFAFFIGTVESAWRLEIGLVSLFQA